MLRRAPARFALAALLFTACADGAVPGYTRETTPDGRAIVSYASGLPAGEDTLVALFEIGKYVDDTSTIFADLRDIAIDGDGRIYALDFQAAQIRVFAADGMPDTIIGRRGEGPGEISQANGLRFGPDGTLWVNDHGKRALLALDRDGRERERLASIVPGYGYRWAVLIDSAGVMWEPWSRSLAGPPVESDPTGVLEGTSLQMFRSFEPATDTRDSVSLHATSWRRYRASFAGGNMVTGLPFSPQAMMTMDRSRRVWIATSGDYALHRIDMSADTTIELRVSETGVPVTPEDIASWKEQWAEDVEQYPTLIDDLMAHMPANKPPFTQLFTDDQARLWVGRTVTKGEAARWDVFNSDGEFLAVIRGPAAANQYMQPVVVGDRIHIIADGDAGERYIVVAELPQLE